MADVPNQINNITLKLKSKDGEIFEVEKPVAMQINFVKGMLEDVDEIDGMEIPMGEVEAAILAKVVEYCKFHYQQELNQTNADEVDRWERAFVQVDKSTLFQLILAANFLDVQSLLDLTCKTVADMIKGKTPEQIRAEFDIDNDFTPEQLEEVRRDNAWCAEDR
ncbi:SKP1-like protein 11 [Gracilariopsis chorda]|uniref:SKP1-like protein 11 n=1 Tax=Gracilariopsis chorda TaxID=448386 RepID=A0A2V3IWB5_9FLOR|nr:SKP1-like protein 11 [Gracilariopsis chorda]|eukprot:PXF46436.1 SKP1-like protein 11 [Gracilariopsis chorda]